jgi:hypothetical protein
MLNIANNARARGFVKVLQTHLSTGVTNTLVEKPNMILYTGANLMAQALAGQPNSKITHMYVGYSNATTVNPVTITLSNANPINENTGNLGYLRLPLAYTPSFLRSDNNHENNIPVFSVSVANPTASGGASFTTGLSKIFQIALVAEGAATDVTFSRAEFTPVEYNSNYALTLQWGVEFTAVHSLVPVISGELAHEGEVDVAMTNYQIIANNTPTSYTASPLPPGLTINEMSGVISGTPTVAGTTNTTISATNMYGTHTATLVFTIAA